MQEEAYDAKKRLKEEALDGDSKSNKKARKLAEVAGGGGAKSSMAAFLRAGSQVATGAALPTRKDPFAKKGKGGTDDNFLADIDSFMSTDAKKPPLSGAQARMRPLVSAGMNMAMHQRLPMSRMMPPHRQAISAYTVSSPSATSYDSNNDFSYDDNNGGHYDMETDGGAEPTTTCDIDAAAAEVKIEVKVEPAKKVSISNTSAKLQRRQYAPAASESDIGFSSKLNGHDSSAFGFASSPGSVSDGIPDSQSSETSASSSNLDTSTWLRTRESEGEGAEGEKYMNMFWLDASESNGIIYLVGKVPIYDEKDDKVVKRFVSCCVAVNGVKRVLHVLPKATGEERQVEGKGEAEKVRLDIGEVHREMSGMLVPSIIPKQPNGVSFRSKVEEKKYAFEFADVPREETKYLKIEYLAKFPAPSAAQCAGGKTYDKIFGGNSSPLENFIMEQKLMGPCWVTIKDPRSMSSSVSWCKLEVAVAEPSNVSVMGNDAPPSPCVTSMCVSLKTAVNPATHIHEVVAISCLTHTKVDLEADTDATSGQFVKRFTLVRQLGASCGPNYPTSFPHDLATEVKRISSASNTVQACATERMLLQSFFNRLNLDDPDVLVSHNLFGFEFDVILARATFNKCNEWSRIGRLRRNKPARSINDRDVFTGRILLDTYKQAKEFVRETSYSLTDLARSQLSGLNRVEVDALDVPKYFTTSRDIIQLASHTAMDALIVQKLMLKLQVIPLTKRLTNISGNLWSRTVKGARAERIEFLLLHEFHAKNFILPERKPFESDNSKWSKKGGASNNANNDDDDDDDEAAAKVGGMGRKRAKAAYAGGLVLEPKRGLYDTYILLLDFNSLYPSIIQEYNLCFTTVEWNKYVGDGGIAAKKLEEDGEEEEEAAAEGSELPALPDKGLEQGVLPRVIKSLVDRRRAVKQEQKKEKDPLKKQNLEIRQKAFKLTANSMYGCLGFSFSRFYARPIAAMVTKMGREALMKTVAMATNTLGLEVIYGDTDSVMINTNSTDLQAVKKIGQTVCAEVNKDYKSLELDIDGVFKSMLLLKKKKYAALTIKEGPDGEVSYEKEMKGLDLVRRDWCPLSKETGKFVVDQILSGNSREDIVFAIHDQLTNLAARVKSGQEDITKFIITKGLNKNPRDYPDHKGQAHLVVAMEMIKQDKPVNVGDHIPYIICSQGPVGSQPAARAKHPDDVLKSNGELTIDIEYYLGTQILPPISRLCEPIEGTSSAILSTMLGLDASKFARQNASTYDDAMDNAMFAAKSNMRDEERFKDCDKLTFTCKCCKEEREFYSLFDKSKSTCSLNCSSCGAAFLGRSHARDCYAYLSNLVTALIRKCQQKYYTYSLVCDDQGCKEHTTHQPIVGYRCRSCKSGRLNREYDDATLHTQLKYLESLFDFERYEKRMKDENANPQDVLQPVKSLLKDETEVYRLLKNHMSNSVNASAYNWIRPSLWTALQKAK